MEDGDVSTATDEWRHRHSLLVSVLPYSHNVDTKCVRYWLKSNSYTIINLVSSPDPPSTLQEERGSGEYSTTFL